jgi:hypothetical protein
VRLAPLLVAVFALLTAGCGGGDTESATTPTPTPKPKPGPVPTSFVVGAVEDAAKAGEADAKMELARRAGFSAIVLSAVWMPPLEAPPRTELASLRAAVAAAARAGIRPIVAVYSFSAATPTSPAARAQFAAYAASIPRTLPEVRDVIVGNEPNLNLFWLPQFGADGSDVAAESYLALLATSYDAIKKVSEGVSVIGCALSARGSDDPGAGRPTHSPTRFIQDLGAAYRASGRTTPVMDMFSLHPYPENSSIPPTFAHPQSTSIGLADYDKLVALLGDAFDGTAQAGSSLPIAYGEYGLQTVIPAAKRGAYTGSEQPTIRPIDEQRQADAYVNAIAIAACQPTVRMLFFFHVSDEPQLERLQTGVYHADDTPKSSLAPVAQAAREAANGRSRCGG